MKKSISVLIATFRRTRELERCLERLNTQTHLPHEVIVAWQADDHPTRDLLESKRESFRFLLNSVHVPEVGIVVAENAALAQASGEIIALIDDDAVAPPHWLEKHAAFYADPRVGAVGGPIQSFHPDGTPLKTKKARGPVGKLAWYGKAFGNIFDQPDEWQTKPASAVNHLAGSNLSLRRSAFACFEDRLLPYWQRFELDACLQVQSRGMKVLFDFSNPMPHYAKRGHSHVRGAEIEIRFCGLAYNTSFILAKHSPWILLPFRLAYLLGIGSTSMPGALAFIAAWGRYGNLRLERQILLKTCGAHLRGTRDGLRARSRS